MNFTSLLNTVVSLFILLAVGFGARKTGLIDDAFSKKLSSLIVKIGQPMLIISSLIALDYSAENLRRGLIALGISFALHTFMAIAAYFSVSWMRDLDERKLSEFAVIFTNCGFVGFPIVESLLGKEWLFCGAFYLIGFHLSLWTWGIFILSRGREDIKLTPKKIFINYGTIPCVIGFILFIQPIALPEFVGKTATFLANLCTPLSLLVAGGLIATESLREFFGRPKLYYVCAVRLLVIPLAAVLIMKLAGVPDDYLAYTAVMAAMPCASMASMLGELYGIKPGYASRLVGLSTVLCTATIPLVVWIVTII